MERWLGTKMAYRHSVYSALPSAQAFCGDLVTSPMFHRRFAPADLIFVPFVLKYVCIFYFYFSSLRPLRDSEYRLLTLSSLSQGTSPRELTFQHDAPHAREEFSLGTSIHGHSFVPQIIV